MKNYIELADEELVKLSHDGDELALEYLIGTAINILCAQKPAVIFWWVRIMRILSRRG